ncbi:MAG: DUF4136 domain-containing protein [Sphingomonadaceae bacterium]
MMTDRFKAKAKGWGRSLKLASVPLLLAGLAACASNFNSDVTRFHTQLPAPQGQTFAIVPENPADAGGLEFAQYAGYVAQQMQRLGYTPVASATDANLVVMFGYGVGPGRERIRSTGFADPFYRPWYGYGSYYGPRWGGYYGGRWAFGMYDPFFDGPNIDSYTVYTSHIDLKIDRAADHQRLFEGKAEALSTSNHLQYLVPNLVEAMFTNFPGDSGQTMRITIAPENMAVKRQPQN